MPDPAVTETGPLVALPAHPEGTAWPTHGWERGTAPAAVGLDALVDEMFADTDRYETTYAVVVVHRGVIVAERYEGALPNWVGDPIPVRTDTPLLSWSMAKSMLHAAVGIVVGDGRLDVDAPGLVPEWTDDERAAITLPDLLAMRDGLAWNEDYVEAGGSQVIEMLFGDGRHDVGAFARARPAAVAPDTRFNYSSGTSNVVSGIVADVVGRGDAYVDFLRERLFAPIGMTSAQPTLDAAGLWVASSYVHATAHDFAALRLPLPARRRVGRSEDPARRLGRCRPATAVDRPGGRSWLRLAVVGHPRRARHVLGERIRGSVDPRLAGHRSRGGTHRPHGSAERSQPLRLAGEARRRVCRGAVT